MRSSGHDTTCQRAKRCALHSSPPPQRHGACVSLSLCRATRSVRFALSVGHGHEILSMLHGRVQPVRIQIV
eukprot:5059317-Prymnesium_polylepis.1